MGAATAGGKGPDYEKFSDAFKRLPHLSAPAGGKVKWILVALVAVWLLSGIYIVNPDEEGVVLRFGKYDRTVGAGPHYALPFPIETVYKPKVTQVQRVEVGFRSVGQGRTFQQGANRSLPEESGMLTGDENIVNVQFSVQYQIKNPVEYLFNVTDQAAVVKNAAEAAMARSHRQQPHRLRADGRQAPDPDGSHAASAGNPRPLQGRACAS